MWLLAPESPRFLVVRNRGDEAMQVLQAAAAMNGRPFPKGVRLDVGHSDHQGATPAPAASALPEERLANKLGRR